MKKLVVALAIVCLLILPVVRVPSWAEEPKLFVKTPHEGFKSLWETTGKTLSGSAKLVVDGRDPRFQRGDKDAKEVFAGERTQSAAAALVPYRSPTTKFSRNMLITRDLSRVPFQTEPHIAVNPKNPDHIVLGEIDYAFPSIVSYVSIDGGSTWDGPYQNRYIENDLGSGGDPTVAFDRNGNPYFAYISIGYEEYSISGVAYADLVSSIAVAKSTDNGRTWSRPESTARSHISVSQNPRIREGPAGELVLGFLDKPWMVVGPDRQDPNKDSIYVTYTEFMQRYQIVLIFQGQFFYFANPVLETTIKFVKSTDGGLTWSRPMAVSPTVKRFYGGEAGVNPGFTTRVVQGSSPQVASDGTVYVAWLDSTDDDSFKGAAEVMVARSDDGGKTFARPVTAANLLEPDFSARTAAFRSWGSAFPQPSIGPRGEIYVVYGARPSGNPVDDGDIYLVSSTDKGRTWTRPKRLNDDSTNRLQFFPTVAVNEKGVIHVMWGDFRDDPNEAAYNIYYTRSEDGGQRWVENSRVTDFPSNPNYGFPNGAFIGDYFSIATGKDEVYMVWADTRLGQFGTFNQKIGFARLNPIPSPSVFLSPSRGPAGKDITVQGFNFQPEQDIFVEVAGAIISTARTDNQGRFTTKVFVPISGQGSHPVRAIDASGNLAQASFFMDYGFDTLRESFSKTTQDIINKISPLESKINRLNTTQAPIDNTAQIKDATTSFEKKVDEIGSSLRRFVGDQLSSNKADQEDLKARIDALSAQNTSLYGMLNILSALVVFAVVLTVASLVVIGRRTGAGRS